MRQIIFSDKKRTRKASIKLIEQAIAENWVKQLAVYHLLKAFYNNSCIYDYRARRDEIAQQLGISTKTWYNYLHILQSKGLVFNHNSNLCLKSIRDFGSRKKCTLLIDRCHTLQDVTDLLYGKVIERRVVRQAFSESIRRFGKGDKSISKLCASPFHPSMSSRTLAKLINASEFKARCLLKSLTWLKEIRVTKQKPRLISKEYIPLNVLDDLLGRRFQIRKFLYEQYGSRIEFVQFPVQLNRVTVRQYNKYIHRDL